MKAPCRGESESGDEARGISFRRRRELERNAAHHEAQLDAFAVRLVALRAMMSGEFVIGSCVTCHRSV